MSNATPAEVEEVIRRLVDEKRNPKIEEVDFLLKAIPSLLLQLQTAQTINRIVSYFLDIAGGELTLDIEEDLNTVRNFGMARKDGKLILHLEPKK